MTVPHRAFEFIYLLAEIVVIILYLLCTEYSTSTQGSEFFKVTALTQDEEATIWQSHIDTWTSYLPVDCTTTANNFEDVTEAIQNAEPVIDETSILTRQDALDLWKHAAYKAVIVDPKLTNTASKPGCDSFATSAISQLQDETMSAEAIAKQEVQTYYPLFQDVHVMIFVGFGFLMVFLKNHSWTSVGYNFLISAYVLQITILIVGFWHQLYEGHWHKISLDITSLILGDFGAGAVMITFGAVLGKVSLPQLWFLATLEIIFYALNETICVLEFKAVDMGGSMYVHTFGAYFGLAASYFYKPKEAKDNEKCEGDYNSQLIAMIGTVFLWMFWPSFNGALAGDFQQQRVIVNTVMAISGSCVTACAISRIFKQKLDMEVVLNATLAGGVSVGSASDLVVTGGTAMAIGGLAGIVSAIGFLKLGPFLLDKINLHDTCGVHNLHGLPGVLGAVIGAISASLADNSFENEETLGRTFAAIAEDGRTTSEQGWYQLAALGCTLGISIIGGLISGFLSSLCYKADSMFDDQEHFDEAHYDFYEVQKKDVPQGQVEMAAPDSARNPLK